LALFYAALSEVLPPDFPPTALVVGLPVSLLQDTIEAAIVLEALKQLDLWLGEILAAIKHTWSSLRRFTVVIPTGGGACLLNDRLTRAVGAKGAVLYQPADPITANVRSFWEYGGRHVGNR